MSPLIRDINIYIIAIGALILLGTVSCAEDQTDDQLLIELSTTTPWPWILQPDGSWQAMDLPPVDFREQGKIAAYNEFPLFVRAQEGDCLGDPFFTYALVFIDGAWVLPVCIPVPSI